MSKKIRNDNGETYCSSCGSKVRETDDSCSSCGDSFGEGKTELSVCLSCGSILEKLEPNCPICGDSLDYNEGYDHSVDSENESDEDNVAPEPKIEGGFNSRIMDMISLGALYQRVEDREQELVKKVDGADGELKKQIQDEMDHLMELKINILEVEDQSNYLIRDYLENPDKVKSEVKPKTGTVSPEEWMAEHKRIQKELFKLKGMADSTEDAQEASITSLKKKLKTTEREYNEKISALEEELENARKEGGGDVGVEKEDLEHILKVLDDLLGHLPDEKIEEFANSENFELYEKVFDLLGI